jgi:hypothetical protein
MVYAPESLASRQSSYLEGGQVPVNAFGLTHNDAKGEVIWMNNCLVSWKMLS